jgi:mRNA degradation ribonuclease J1/J2
MVSLRFYGGLGEIGGNKFLVEDGDVRFWLGFGRSFSVGSDALAASEECEEKEGVFLDTYFRDILKTTGRL